MRGEHDRAAILYGLRKGSSPHARGALVVALPGLSVVGIIPACAGSTWTTSQSTSASGDHPRMRGEHPPASLTTSAPQGSSPHARGAPP